MKIVRIKNQRISLMATLTEAECSTIPIRVVIGNEELETNLKQITFLES